MAAQSTCSACSYIVRHRLLKCQTILLVVQLLALTIAGHVEMAFMLLMSSLVLVLLVFAEGMFRVALMLTQFTADGDGHGLELGAAIVESLHKSPFYTAALALATQSYQTFVATRTMSASSMLLMAGGHPMGTRTDGMAVLEVPELKRQIEKCHQRINITIILWIAVVSSYSLFTLAMIPLTNAHFPQIYLVFAVFLFVTFLGIGQGFELLCQQLCNKRARNRPATIFTPNGESQPAAAALALSPEQQRRQKEAAVLAFAHDQARRQREAVLQDISIGREGTATRGSGEQPVSAKLDESVARIKYHLKPVTGLLIDEE